MIQTLSIHKMGEMARTLVSVTAFRKNSGRLPTVGGPIDVLAISHVDGVKWLDKKKLF